MEKNWQCISNLHCGNKKKWFDLSDLSPPLKAKAIMRKPSRWFSLQINWLVSTRNILTLWKLKPSPELCKKRGRNKKKFDFDFLKWSLSNWNPQVQSWKHLLKGHCWIFWILAIFRVEIFGYDRKCLRAFWSIPSS